MPPRSAPRLILTATHGYKVIRLEMHAAENPDDPDVPAMLERSRQLRDEFIINMDAMHWVLAYSCSGKPTQSKRKLL
ncbi:MAG: hypothetical protein Q9P01_09025 [Anaerolineae bacterium]|nr:hypothetical protein [Anaerolineae bacterium]